MFPINDFYTRNSPNLRIPQIRKRKRSVSDTTTIIATVIGAIIPQTYRIANPVMCTMEVVITV